MKGEQRLGKVRLYKNKTENMSNDIQTNINDCGTFKVCRKFKSDKEINVKNVEEIKIFTVKEL